MIKINKFDHIYIYIYKYAQQIMYVTQGLCTAALRPHILRAAVKIFMDFWFVRFFFRFVQGKGSSLV